MSGEVVEILKHILVELGRITVLLDKKFNEEWEDDLLPDSELEAFLSTSPTREHEWDGRNGYWSGNDEV
jgi:hypothetical protein